MNLSKLYGTLMRAYGRFASTVKLMPPLRVQIEPTHRCNLGCKFCCRDKINYKRDVEMTREEINKIVLSLPSHTLITYTGGEIFVRKDMLDILKDTLVTHRCNIVTNGTFLSDEIIDILAGSKNMLLVSVSIDGPRDIHDRMRDVPGTFDKVTRFIETIQKRKEDDGKKFPLIDIKTLLTADSIPYLPELFKIVEDFRADYFTLAVIRDNPLVLGSELVDKIDYDALRAEPEVSEKIDVELLERQLNKLMFVKTKTKIRLYPDMPVAEVGRYYRNKLSIKEFLPCFYPWTTVRIAPNGDVYPCISYDMGNAKDDGLQKVWKNESYSNFRKVLKKAKIFPICMGCCYQKYKK